MASLTPEGILLSRPERISQGRMDDMVALFRLMGERQPRQLVETGTLRGADSTQGDGGMTWHLGKYAHLFGGHLTTVDISPGAIACARSLTLEFADSIGYVCSDSVLYLSGRTKPIDLLYLDSLDYNGSNPRPCQEHALREAQAASLLLRPRSIVALDDCGVPDGGKGGLAVPWLLRNGWSVRSAKYMTVLTKEKS